MKKVVIIGAGFAGLSCAQRLFGRGLEITLLDKKGQFNFLPLIPDCIGRGINPDLLVNDLAGFCLRLKIRFVQQEVVSVDLVLKQVQTGQAVYAYDYLVIASGSQTNFFSNSDAQNYSYPLNNAGDVKKIIERLNKNDFENLIICGGGYTGVEAATNLWLYCKKKKLNKRIIIIERSPGILGVLPSGMKEYAANNLKSMGIEILANTVIEQITTDRVLVSGGAKFERPILIWVPGVNTAGYIQKLGVPKNPQGRIIVDEYLRVNPDCFCVGDTAAFGQSGVFLRMAVQFAIMQGGCAARNIVRSVKKLPLKKYRPLDLGYVIPMANNRSCGRILGMNISGSLATFLHFGMCIFRSWGWKNRWGLMVNLLKGGA